MCDDHMLWLAAHKFQHLNRPSNIGQRCGLNKKKKTTNIPRSSGCHLWSREAFPVMEQGGLHLVALFPNQAWHQQRVDEAKALAAFVCAWSCCLRLFTSDR